MVIKIREYSYDVSFVDQFDDLLVDARDSHQYHFGMCSWKEQKIYIAKGLNRPMARRVVTHEITHAVLEAYGFHAHRDNFNNEDICEFLSVYADEIISLTNQVMEEVYDG